MDSAAVFLPRPFVNNVHSPTERQNKERKCQANIQDMCTLLPEILNALHVLEH
jgi:hypothetical protein